MDSKDKNAPGNMVISSIAAQAQTATPFTVTDNFFAAAPEISRPAGGVGKIPVRDATTRQNTLLPAGTGSPPAEIPARNPFGLPPTRPDQAQQNLGQQRESGIVAVTVNGAALDDQAALTPSGSSSKDQSLKNVELHFEDRTEGLDQNLNHQLARIESRAANGGKPADGSQNLAQYQQAPQAQSATGNTLGVPLTAQLPPPGSRPEGEERAGERRAFADAGNPSFPAAQTEEAKARLNKESIGSKAGPTGPAQAQEPRLSEPTPPEKPSGQGAMMKMDPKLMQRYGLRQGNERSPELMRRSGSPSKDDRGSEELRKKKELQQQVDVALKQRNLQANADGDGKTVEEILGEKSSAVNIVNPAQAKPEQSPTLWERFGGAATRTARIEVAKDTTEVAPLLAGAQNQTSFDPYFIQTEQEKIKSKSVLYKVIEKLNLNEAWAKKLGGSEKLKTSEIYPQLVRNIDVRQARGSSQIDIQVKSDSAEEAARIANTVAEVYRDLRLEKSREAALHSKQTLEKELSEQEKGIARAKEELERRQMESKSQQTDVTPAKPAASAPVPQPEVQTLDNAFSTFSLNISDVSFRLAAASLEKGAMPEPATVRSEEFINAFDYRDSEPPPGAPLAFAWERARYPFAHNRDLLRFSVKTAAQGRQAGRPLNIVLLLDNSGSMERADRVQTIREALRVLAAQLQPQDKLSVVAFARTARLWADGVPGNQAGQVAEQVSNFTPQGGTNLEDAMNLGYQTAQKHYFAGGVNRVVLLTDGAANLGNVDPEALKQKVEAHRKQGIALDCFGIGWEGFNDDLLEVLSRNGDGRYGFVNTPEEAATEFAGKLAGAFRVAASDVKVQVEFNPKRVTAYRQIGYAKHQLTKEQFRDNTVDAAEIGAAESGNALYVVEVNPRGEGLLAVVRVRYKAPDTGFYYEHEWAVPYSGNAVTLEQASPALRLAASASGFSEWLVSSPYAAEVTPDRLLAYLSGVPEVYGIDPRPKKLEWMIRQAKSIAGR